MKHFASLFLLCALFQSQISCAQPLHHKKSFSRQDTLRGTITPERAWWDVTCYTVGVSPNFNGRSIEGKSEIQFKVLKPGQVMQIDLQEPMFISRVYSGNTNLSFERDGDVYFVRFPQPLKEGALETITLVYHGTPRPALTPPWDGGWIWSKDKQGRPWMSVAVQGLGASAWYPCKDHQSDEPDSAFIHVAVPDSLVAVANGRLINKKSFSPGMTTYQWAVKNPINNYNIVPYIGKYVNWTETFAGEKGNLTCSYWVLDYNLEKAKKQFSQVSQTLKALEYWFGPYPFYDDTYKLVEAPHLGMEHQSAVAYGNGFRNGYQGQDLSHTGWGLKWDYIIVHETGHEWFGNNITTKDIADMWVHEGFTDYSETLFIEYYHGKEAANTYVQGLRQNIKNDRPIIGAYGVNQEGSGDMYFKGANMIHTIRQVMNDDEKFRSILRGLNKEFYHQTVTTQQVEQYISQKSGIDFSKVFDQYLRTTQIPVLELRAQGNDLQFRWTNTVPGFNMPVQLTNGQWITPTNNWQSKTFNQKLPQGISANPNFYIKVQ